jgi:Ca2+-binding RTX toxin-like protein
MATYSFAAGSQAFTTADRITFGATVSAKSLTITTVGADLTLASGVTMTLTGFSVDKILSTNFIFADGSRLIVGDNLTTTVNDAVANTLIGGLYDDQLLGLAGNDTLIGNDGDDKLDGGADIDTVKYQGAAADYAVVVNLTTGTATGGAGSDTLLSIENVIGSDYNDTITGSAVANTLDGGLGADLLTGNDGKDTYMVDSNDLVVETNTGTAATEIDLVISSVSYVLTANVENLTLTGSAINGTGNGLVNTITGNASNNMLDGAGGLDILIGGLGNDTYVISSGSETITELGNGGVDTVQSTASYSLATRPFIENIRLLGSGNINATGNLANNTLLGNSGNNSLDGGDGADAMIGGKGNDTYVIDVNSGTLHNMDSVTEAVNAGTDLVQSSVSYALGANLENLTLLGSANINATGNGVANTLTGNSGANVLTGGTGADIMDGAGGADTYSVDNTADTVTDSVAGTGDSIISSVNFNLATGGASAANTNVENLTLIGSATTGTGNDSANTITGNALNNILSAAAGNDILDGGLGKDTLTGGLNNDTFVFSAASHTLLGAFDIITDFTVGASADKINLTAIFGGGQLTGATTAGFEFIDITAFHADGTHPEVRFDTATSKVLGDVNADGVADFAIQLTGITTNVLVDANFI